MTLFSVAQWKRTLSGVLLFFLGLGILLADVTVSIRAMQPPQTMTVVIAAAFMFIGPYVIDPKWVMELLGNMAKAARPFIRAGAFTPSLMRASDDQPIATTAPIPAAAGDPPRVVWTPPGGSASG